MTLHRGPETEPPELSGFEDEALVTLAQGGCLPAEHTLVLRYLRIAQRLVGWLARRYGVGAEDAADAKQEAVSFWVRQAIVAYDVRRSVGADACRFRTLLHQVLVARFRNYTRDLKRRQAHLAAGVAPEQCPAAHRERPTVFGRWEGSDPAEAVEWRELRALLDRAVGELPAQMQRLWDWVSTGQSLRQWALGHGVDYKRVQRTWRKVVGTVIARVRGDEAPPAT